MDPVLSVSYATIAAFFEAAEGSYRNAVYVSCACAYTRESGCGDFLFIPGHDCRPILLPVTDAENFMGRAVDRTECACTMSSGASSASTADGWSLPLTPQGTAPSSRSST